MSENLKMVEVLLITGPDRKYIFLIQIIDKTQTSTFGSNNRSVVA
jgi:hypothetical protein